ncbi:MAG: DnaB-like helicase C-terminal domain-containing protein [Planctomycetota bacterium]|nr:DnaB-like helicase C-terminal domain-containing protein [Planctomycetota bacterium]
MGDGSREQPHDLFAEKSVLGCLFVNPATLPVVRRILSSPTMFYRKTHGMTFRCMCKIADRHEPINQVSVNDEMQRLKYLDIKDTSELFNQFIESDAFPHNVENHAKIIRRTYSYREVISAGNRIVELGHSNPEEPEKMFADVKAAAAAACGSAEYGDGAISPADCAALVWDHLEGGDSDAKPSAYIPVGMCDIEIPRGIVSTIGGRTTNGKTALVMNWEMNLAKAGHQVLHMGMEDTATRYNIRMIANLAGVDSEDIAKGRVTAEERQKILDACTQRAALPISVCDKKGITVDFIRQFAAAHQAVKGLSLLVVDYIQLIRGRRGQSGYEKVSDAMQDLVIVAEELDVALIVVSQVGRPSNKTGIPDPPTMHDLKESGEIENVSKMVFLVHRPCVYDDNTDNTILLLHIAKVSEGATGHRTLRGYMPHMKVGELAHGDDENRPGEY